VSPDGLPSSVEVGRDGLPVDPTAPFGPTGAPTIPVEPLAVEEEEEAGEVPIGVRTRRLATILICLNSMLGIGILGVANGFANTGFVTSVIVLLLMAGLSLIATWMVIVLAQQTGTKGFPELAAHLLGKAGANALSVLTLIFLICAEVAYLILGGDMIISWFALAGISMHGMAKRAPLVGIYSLCIPVALSLPRNIGFLSYVSAATVLAVLFYGGVIIYEAVTLVSARGIAASAVVNKIDVDIFSAIAMFGLSFALPSCIMPAIRAYNPQIRKRKIVTGFAMGLVLVLVLISGLSGYMIFGAGAQANILNSFSDDDTLIVVVRAGFFIVVSCAYPMVLQTIEAAWSAVFYGDDYPAGLPGRRRAIVLFASNAIPMAIAMFVPDAKPVLEVGGGLGGCIVDFVFPAILWIKNSGRPWTHYQNLLSIALAIFGVACAAVSTYLAVIGAIESYM
jgi:amino acid permease